YIALHSPAPPLPLHSFPTRRSSDLWLWILIIVSCAVYAADAFTAVNLLAFNKWSSQVKPKVPFEVAKWIFAITIIISYVFLIYRDRKSTRLNSSHVSISYAVFCLKK